MYPSPLQALDYFLGVMTSSCIFLAFHKVMAVSLDIVTFSFHVHPPSKTPGYGPVIGVVLSSD